MVPSTENFPVTTTVVVVAQGLLLDVQLINARIESSASAAEVSKITFPNLPIGFPLPESVLLSLSESHA